MTSPAKLRALAMRWYSVLGVKIITSNESAAGKGPKGHIVDLHDGFTFVGNPKTTQYRRNLFFEVLPCGLSNKKYKPPLLKIMAPSSPRIKKAQIPTFLLLNREDWRRPETIGLTGRSSATLQKIVFLDLVDLDGGFLILEEH